MSINAELDPKDMGIIYQDWSENDEWANLADSYDEAAVEELRVAQLGRVGCLQGRLTKEQMEREPLSKAPDDEAASNLLYFPFEMRGNLVVLPEIVIEALASRAS